MTPISPTSEFGPEMLKSLEFCEITAVSGEGISTAPAKPAVYAFFSADGKPLLAAVTGNLRATLGRRLAPKVGLTPYRKASTAADGVGAIPASPAPGALVDYSGIVKSISYLKVCSSFWGNWIYSLVVRKLFPRDHQQLIGWKPAWFLSLQPDAPTPVFSLSTKIAQNAQVYGPLAGRGCGQNLIQELTDLFDLCRYEEILRQSPNGRPCAYKEMGKCPAPCDGSVAMTDYRAQLRQAAGVLEQWDHPDRGGIVQELENAMRAAALRMDFRLAGKLRDKCDQLRGLYAAGADYLVPINRWGALVLAPGNTGRWIEPFVASVRGVWRLEQVRTADFVQQPRVIMGRWRETADACFHEGKPASRVAQHVPAAAAEDIVSLLCYHQFRTRDTGLYIPHRQLADNDTAITRVIDWLSTGPRGEVNEGLSSDQMPSAARSSSGVEFNGEIDMPGM